MQFSCPTLLLSCPLVVMSWIGQQCSTHTYKSCALQPLYLQITPIHIIVILIHFQVTYICPAIHNVLSAVHQQINPVKLLNFSSLPASSTQTLWASPQSLPSTRRPISWKCSTNYSPGLTGSLKSTNNCGLKFWAIAIIALRARRWRQRITRRSVCTWDSRWWRQSSEANWLHL